MPSLRAHSARRSRSEARRSSKSASECCEAALASHRLSRRLCCIPTMASIYREKVAEPVARRLHDDDSRDEAAEIIRGLVERIVVRADARAASRSSCMAIWPAFLTLAIRTQSSPQAVGGRGGCK